MIQSRFFWRLYFTYAALVLITSGSIGFMVLGRLERTLTADLRASLEKHCVLLEPLALDVAGGADAQATLERIRSMAQLRVTLVAPDGRVLADSHEDSRHMENHRNRPELLAAVDAEFGMATRYSNTVGYEMLYVAHRVPSRDEPLVAIRVAMAMSEVDLGLAAAQRSMLAGASVGVVVALLLGVVVARLFNKPVAEMTLVAQEMREGNYDERVVTLPPDELGLLGRTLNRLGEELTGRIQTIRGDEARLRAILAAMVEGVVAVDDDDRVIFCNSTARELLDLGSQNLRGRPIWELVRVVGLTEAMDEARSNSAGARRELALRVGERDMVVEALVNPLATDAARGRIIVLHDVTELRRLEQIRREFVANVSHELKTPLTSIKGYIETLLDGALEDPKNNRRFLTRIHSNVDRLSFLVTDLLSLARIESQRDRLDLVPLELFAVVREVATRYDREIEKRELTLHLGSGAGVQILGEREAVVGIVDNLLSNAIKYTPAGGRISIEQEVTPAHVTLIVEDTGIGIPAGDLDRVFERFYRVDKARSRDLGGTGLGLAIVKHLTLAMRGEVSVESEPGHGSRFCVRLPAAT